MLGNRINPTGTPLRSLAVGCLILAASGATARAGELGPSSLTSPGSSASRERVYPLTPQTLTQSTEPNSVSAGSIACGNGVVTTENSWFRLFDLDVDHSLNGDNCVESVDYAIETAIDQGVPQSIVITTTCLDDGLPYLRVFLDEVGSHTHPQPDADLEFFNATASGCCNAETQSMSIELEAPLDCTVNGCGQLYIGSNNLGQSAPTYFASESCSVSDPTDILFGFPGMHLVMSVYLAGSSDGPCDPDPCPDEDGDVPAVGTLGAIVLLLLSLAAGSVFLRREATS